MNKLEEMVSQRCYDEIVDKVKYYVGEESLPIIWPAVKKAIEQGSGTARENILIGWLNCDTCRVCSECGAIMQEGWYMDSAGYACSDECAAKMERLTMDEFRKWRIYKSDIEYWLECEGKGRSIESLTKEECDDIISSFIDNCDYFYTEWY